TADNDARLNRILDPLSSPLLSPLRAAAKRLLQLCGSCVPDQEFQPKRHYPRAFDRLIYTCDFKKMKSPTVGFGPFTFLGKELFSEASAVGLHRRLQTFASREGLSPLRWNGSHYLVLAQSRMGRNTRSTRGEVFLCLPNR